MYQSSFSSSCAKYKPYRKSTNSWLVCIEPSSVQSDRFDNVWLNVGYASPEFSEFTLASQSKKLNNSVNSISPHTEVVDVPSTGQA